MRIFNAVLISAIWCSAAVVSAAQSGPSGATVSVASPPKVTPSGLLQPSLDTVQQTVGALHLEKWKKGTVRDEAEQNVDGIMRDLKDNLPSLLHDADAAPDSVSKVMPVSRNVNALYDVLLRVSEASRVSGTGDQATQLQQALVSLGNARHALEDRLVEAAAAQEKQVSDLRVTVQTQNQTVAKLTAKAAAVPPPCPAPTPVRRARKKPQTPATNTQKPATPTPQKSSPTAPQKSPPTTPQKSPASPNTTPKSGT